MNILDTITNHGQINYFPILIVIIFISIGFLSQKKKIEVLNKLSDTLQGYVSKFTFTPSFNGEIEGVSFRIKLTPASRSSPAYLTIFISKNSSFRLKVYKESFLSKMGERLGIVQEVKTNDEMFDKDFLIFSNNHDQGATYLNSANAKNIIREFFDAGFNVFLINGKQVLIQKPNYRLEEDLEPQNIKMLLQKLTLLTRSIV